MLIVWCELGLDRFWSGWPSPSHKGKRWHHVLFEPVAYRWTSVGNERRLHHEWFDPTALPDLFGIDRASTDIPTLYECHERLLEHKTALFDHLVGRWPALFNASFDVLLSNLTSTYSE